MSRHCEAASPVPCHGDSPDLREVHAPLYWKYGVLLMAESHVVCESEILSRLMAGSYEKPFIRDHGAVRSLHFDMHTIQSAMRLNNPFALDLAYTRRMMAFLHFKPGRCYSQRSAIDPVCLPRRSPIMKTLLRLLPFLLAFGISARSVCAAGDLTAQEPIVIKVQLGSHKDELHFFPDTINLETGKLYRLILSNPSRQKHYFFSEGMAEAIFTRKVQVNGPGGESLAEAKGVIREIEVYPGATTEWWFVPVRTGHFRDLKCTIAGHAAAGMVGTIFIR